MLRRTHSPRSTLRFGVGFLLLLAVLLQPATSAAAPEDGPGGPILVISRAANPFSDYYAEILRAEGLNEFSNTVIADVTPAVLDSHDVAILADGPPLTAAKAQMLRDWVQAGGNLIAMRPDPKLAGLLGLGDTPGTLANGYLQVDTGSGPGTGIVDQTIQYHGTADRYTTGAGTQTIATLFSDATTSTPNPAVTLRSVGPNGGQAAAFTYDLARSIVYTRQGNPAWSGDERDSDAGGGELIRADDLFYGAKAGDVQPDWVNLDKVAIPQADEQQHLLANLIGQINQDRKPAAAVLVPAARQEGGGRDDRRRPRQRWNGGALQPVRRAQLERLLDRRLGVRAGDLVHLPEHPVAHRLRGRRVRGRRVRDRPARQHGLLQLGLEGRARVLLHRSARGLRNCVSLALGAGHQPHPLHRLERLGDAAEGRAGKRHPPRHELLLLAALPGSRTVRACSRAPACRCASPTSTAR